MSYTWSKLVDNADGYVAFFRFPGLKEVRINIGEESDMKKLEELFDYCTKLGAEQAKDTTCR